VPLNATRPIRRARLPGDYSYGTLSHAQLQIKTGDYFMILRRALTGGLFGLVLVAAAPVSAANAAPGYPPETGALTVSATVVTVGSTITVSGGGFEANSTVNVTTTLTAQGFAGAGALSGGLGSFRGSAPQRLAAAAAAAAAVTADASGSFSTGVTLTQVGTVVITASGVSDTGASRVLSATVQVVAAGGAGGAGAGSGGAGSGTGGGSGVGGSGSLPNTGASLRLPIALGAILVLGGAGLITAVRRRKRGSATA